MIIFGVFMLLGFRWEGGGGEAAQGKHQETEFCGGTAGKRADKFAVGLRGAAGKE